MKNELRLCLDLNIWVGALLCDARGKTGTITQQVRSLVLWEREESGPPATLIISWGMLNRLQKVLTQQLQLSPATITRYIDDIAALANYPRLVLGGTGIIPIRDEEDAAVLETAIAGRADALITRNFADFVTSQDVRMLREREAARYEHPAHSLLIVQPFTAMSWIRGVENF